MYDLCGMIYTGVKMNWLIRLLGRRNGETEYMTLSALAGHTGISLSALRMAVFDRRLEAKKSGHTWLSTVEAVEQAIQEKKLRRP